MDVCVSTTLKKNSALDTSITHLISVIKPSPRKCLTLDQTKEFFPLNDNMDTLKLRNRNKYRVTEGNTERIQEFYNTIHPENAE